MDINRYNCEARFLDYYEKNLSPVEVAEMLFFLEENPDLKQVFESYEAIHLEHEKINFPSKESLKKKYSSEEIEIILSSEITRTNCEQFFIASAEGLLSASAHERLNAFLLTNSELKHDFNLFQKCKLSSENTPFEHKDLLKKELITEQNKEEYFIRAIENELTVPKQKALNLFLNKNIAFKQEFELFKKTILVAENISFDRKASLKRRDKKPIFISFYSQRSAYYAAAAAILFLAGLFFVFRNNDNADTQLFAGKTNSANSTIIRTNKIDIESSIKEQEQKAVPQINESNSAKHQTSNIKQNTVKQNTVKQNPVSNKTEIKEEKTQMQPILSEDVIEEKLLAQNDETQLPIMKEEKTAAQSNLPEEKINIVGQKQSTASTKKVQKNNNDYQTLSAFVTKKVRSLLGVKNSNPCASSDKLGWWDLAMAAKNQVQKIAGTKALDVNKVCDGAGNNKVEYVFAAGNFELSKNTAK